jgi:hypothetical protein
VVDVDALELDDDPANVARRDPDVGLAEDGEQALMCERTRRWS